MIPKIIWTYFDSETLPEYICNCVDTWKKVCNTNKLNAKHTWKFNILNKYTVKSFLTENVDYPDEIWSDSPVKHSDMFGAALVNKYGGVYMDANILMLHPIDFMLEKEWFGYYHDNNP